jgi:hypothetical protein
MDGVRFLRLSIRNAPRNEVICVLRRPKSGCRTPISSFRGAERSRASRYAPCFCEYPKRAPKIPQFPPWHPRPDSLHAAHGHKTSTTFCRSDSVNQKAGRQRKRFRRLVRLCPVRDCRCVGRFGAIRTRQLNPKASGSMMGLHRRGRRPDFQASCRLRDVMSRFVSLAHGPVLGSLGTGAGGAGFWFLKEPMVPNH